MRSYLPSTKVWLYWVGFSILLMMLGYHFGGRWGLFFGFILTLTFHLLIFFFGDSRLAANLGARELKGQDPWGLQKILFHNARLLQLAKPSLFIFENTSSVAFSVGRSWWKNSAICLSSGLLQSLTPAEVEAVVVQQLCHIYRLNKLGFALLHVLAFSILGLAGVFDRGLSILFPFIKKSRRWQHLFTELVSPLAWLILKLAASDKIYFETDEMAALMLKDRRCLAQALWKLESLSRCYPLQLPPCSNHFFIVNPSLAGEKNWFLLAHPKVDIRIRKLIGYFPI
jgi:heat shock protein HtpX